MLCSTSGMFLVCPHAVAPAKASPVLRVKSLTFWLGGSVVLSRVTEDSRDTWQSFEFFLVRFARIVRREPSAPQLTWRAPRAPGQQPE